MSFDEQSVFDHFLIGERSIALQFFLDDSKHVNSVYALGGYVGDTEAWKKYETDSAQIYHDFNVNCLHTLDLHRNDGEFAGWSVQQRIEFVEALFDLAKLCDLKGLSACASSAVAKKAKTHKKITAQHSALSLLFTAFCVDALRVEGEHELGSFSGASLIVESGNKNNQGIASHFNKMQSDSFQGKFENLIFQRKDRSRAIHLADFWAFYSRRSATRMVYTDNPKGPDVLVLPAVKRCPHSMICLEQVNDPSSSEIAIQMRRYHLEETTGFNLTSASSFSSPSVGFSSPASTSF